MSVGIVIIGLVVAYLIGSFPTAIILGKAKFGIDIRDHGSGNAGATNTFRVLGAKAGSFVMAVDVFKGYVATSLVYALTNFDVSLDTAQFNTVQLAYGMAAVLGHVFPIYANFRGGKGVATLLGLVLAFNTSVALACVVVFLVVFLSTKYVSLGSMLSGIAYPIFLQIPVINQKGLHWIDTVFGVVVAILLIWTHKKNIGRLLKGEENKIEFGKKKD